MTTDGFDTGDPVQLFGSLQSVRRLPAKEERIGLRQDLGRVPMQVFVRGYCTMIAAPIESDVNGIPKGSHRVNLPTIRGGLEV